MSTSVQSRRATARSRIEASVSGRGRSRHGYRVKFGYWWWSLPAILLTGVVIYVSSISGAFYAFTDWTGVGSFNLTGLTNFEKIFKTPQLVGALTHTLGLAVGYVVLTNIFGLLFALAL